MKYASGPPCYRLDPSPHAGSVRLARRLFDALLPSLPLSVFYPLINVHSAISRTSCQCQTVLPRSPRDAVDREISFILVLDLPLPAWKLSPYLDLGILPTGCSEETLLLRMCPSYRRGQPIMPSHLTRRAYPGNLCAPFFTTWSFSMLATSMKPRRGRRLRHIILTSIINLGDAEAEEVDLLISL